MTFKEWKDSERYVQDVQTIRMYTRQINHDLADFLSTDNQKLADSLMEQIVDNATRLGSWGLKLRSDFIVSHEKQEDK